MSQAHRVYTVVSQRQSTSMSRYSIQWAWPLSMFFSQFLMMHWNIWKSKQNRADIRLQHNLHSHWRMHMCIQQKLYDSYICTIYNVCHSKRDYKICRVQCTSIYGCMALNQTLEFQTSTPVRRMKCSTTMSSHAKALGADYRSPNSVPNSELGVKAMFIPCHAILSFSHFHL